MAGFGNLSELVEAEVCYGKRRFYTWRKSPTQVTPLGVWFDLSMSPGNPIPQYYASTPLISVQIKQSTDGGIFHGANVSPQVKYIRKTSHFATVVTGLPMPMILCDYLLYYPFIDEGTTDEQVFTNSASLPRHVTGDGVQIMAVSVANRGGGQLFNVKYTNQDGVSGRITPNCVQNSTSMNGNILTSTTATNGSAGPFMPLQNGDLGVRSIESVTMLGTDVGLFTLVLVKPILQTQIRGIDAPVENDYLRDRGMDTPVIVDDAYLNWLCFPQGSLSATAIHGIFQITWN